MEITKYEQVWKLWMQFEEDLKYYMLKKLGDATATHDLHHEVMLKIHTSCCSGKEIGNIKSWIYQIANHTIIDHYRDQKKIQNEKTHSIDSTLENKYAEMSAFIEPLLGCLPKKYAQPLLLSDIKGLKLQEIADRLSLSLPATKSRVQRARKLLKTEIHSCFVLDVDKKSGLLDFSLKEECRSLRKFVEEKNGECCIFFKASTS